MKTHFNAVFRLDGGVYVARKRILQNSQNFTLFVDVLELVIWRHGRYFFSDIKYPIRNFVIGSICLEILASKCLLIRADADAIIVVE